MADLTSVARRAHCEIQSIGAQALRTGREMLNSPLPKFSFNVQEGLVTAVLQSRDVAKVLESDRRFFERNPSRLHSLRWAAVAEIAGELEPHGNFSPRRHRPAVAVKRIADAGRVRVFLYWPTIRSVAVNEERARQVFEAHITAATKRTMDHLIDELSIRHG